MKRALPWFLWSMSFMILGFIYQTQWPQLLTWLRVQVALQTAKHTPLRVLPGGVEFHLSPPGLSIKNIQLTPNNTFKKYLPSLHIDRLQVSVNAWQLAQGRVHIAEIALFGVKGALNIPTAGSGTTITAQELLRFPKMLNVPIEQVRLEDTYLKIALPDEEVEISTYALNSTLSLQEEVWGLEIQTPKLSAHLPAKNLNVALSVRGGARLSADQLQIVNFFIKQRRSILRINGELQGDAFSHKISSIETIPPGFASVQALIDAKTLTEWWNETLPQQAIPTAHGLVKFGVRAEKPEYQPPRAQLQVETKKLGIEQFYVGDLSLSADANMESAQIQQLKLQAPAGHLSLDGARIALKSPYVFSADAELKSGNLHELLKAVSAGDLPLQLAFASRMSCQGQVETFKVSCEGGVQGSNLGIWADDQRQHLIVKVPTMEGEGKATATLQAVTYEAKVKMPLSSGSSQGSIVYKEGFQIKYQVNVLDFKDVADLAGLGVEGRGSLEGVTSGDSHAATFDLKAKLQDTWLTDFGLGNIESSVSYRKGHLYFNNGQGQLGASTYRANVDVNFLEDRLRIDGESNQLNVTDGLAAFARKFELPVSASGQGTVQAHVEGPFRFNGLNYDFKSQIFRGTIAGESFDRLIFHVRSKNGEVRTENVQLTKGRSVVTMLGAGHPNGNIEVKVEGRQFRLEDSESISALGSNLTGIAHFDLKLSDYVLSPVTELHVVVPRMAIGEDNIGASESRISVTSNTFQGSGSFFDEKLKGEFSFPYKPSAPFRLKASAKNFDFSWLADLLVGGGERTEFASALDTEIDLASPTGGFWNASGFMRLKKLALRRGNQQIFLRKPTEWKAQAGHWDLQPSTIEGDGTFLEIKNNRPAKQKLDISLSGKLNLGMFYLLTPPLGDLRGTLSTKSQLRADETGFEIFGSGFIEKGLVKIKNLLHPFQNIRADLIFNQRKITATSLTAEFAGGTLTGETQVEIRGARNVPVHLIASLNDADLFIPEGFRTKGSGQFDLTGSWLPFFLKGNFHAKSGLMSKEFTDSKATQTSVRPSIYLPQTVTAISANTPLRLDLNVDINKDYIVKNSMMDSPVHGNLHVTGTINQPQLAGTIHLVRGGKVYARENEFEVITANAIFTEAKPNDPKLYVSALNRFDDGTQTFDINLLLLGTAQKPDLKLSSQPPMTQEEIVSLLALGVKPEKFERNLNESQQGIQAGSRLGSALFADNAFKKQIKNKTGFDVDIGSTTQRNYAERNRNAALDDSTGVTVPKIVVSRQWTPKFSTTASRTQGDVSTSDVKLRYKLNRTISMIGSWQNREFDSTNVRAPVQSSLNSGSRFGVDLEYKVEFK